MSAEEGGSGEKGGGIQGVKGKALRWWRRACEGVGGAQFQARYEEECRMAIRRIEGEKQRGREDAESGRNIELQTVQSTRNKRPSNQISHQTEGFYMCAGDKKLPLAWLIDTVITGTRSETFPISLVNLLPPRFKGTHMLQTVFLVTTDCFSSLPQTPQE